MNIDENFLNKLWELTRGLEEDRDRCIQKALKVCKTFKVRFLKTPNLDVSPKKTAYNHFYKDMRKKKEKLKSITVSQASAIILREWKKLKLLARKALIIVTFTN